ncbi:MAG: PEGA domain-containing protein [Bacteroidetes bacterium]|nr:PEGA domain-containing protein [Bacteroidota bacterium]
MSEYGIQLRSAQVWQLKLTGEKRSNLISISVVRNIPDSKITIDGFEKGVENVQQVAVGEHTIRIEKEGYKPIEQTINVSPKNILFEYNLVVVEPVITQFKSTPKEARVIINNAEKGITDFGDYIYPGTYQVRLIKSGYLDYNAQIEVKEGEEKVYNFDLIRNISVLKLTVNPPDAQVKINFQIYNQKTIELLPDEYDIEVLKAGYLSATEKLTLALGDTVNKSFTLSKNAGIINVTLNPPNAKILLNKKEYTGQKSFELLPGMYLTEISKEGYTSISENIQIKIGDQIQKTWSLQQLVGSLRYNVKPLNANVQLERGGRAVQNWEGMKYIKELPVGEYKLVTKLEGYRSKTSTLIVKENETVEENITLEEGNEYVTITNRIGSNYNFWIDGSPEGNTSASSISLPVGEHEIRMTDSEGKTVVSQTVKIKDLPGQKISIRTESIFPNVLESAALPGLGQFLSNRKVMGGIYAAAFAGAAAWHYLTLNNYWTKKDELQTTLNAFNAETSPSVQFELGLKMNKLFSEANDLYKKTESSIWIPVAVYAVNLIDVLFFTPSAKSISISSLNNMEIIPFLSVNEFGYPTANFAVSF